MHYLSNNDVDDADIEALAKKVGVLRYAPSSYPCAGLRHQVEPV